MKRETPKERHFIEDTYFINTEEFYLKKEKWIMINVSGNKRNSTFHLSEDKSRLHYLYLYILYF